MNLSPATVCICNAEPEAEEDPFWGVRGVMPSAAKSSRKQLDLSLLVLQGPFKTLENFWLQTEELLIQG